MNRNEQLKQSALSIFQAGLQAVDPFQAVVGRVTVEGKQLLIRADEHREVKFDLEGLSRIVVVGAGKATAMMCKALESILGDRIDDGLIVVKTGYTTGLDRVRMVEAAHPVPDAAGVRGTAEMLATLDGLDQNSLVLALISGGGSALLPQPAGQITLSDKQNMTDLLLAAGASIHEINTIRKHVSGVKGGNLARRAHPASVVSLILSDVVGDPLDTIASGPTVPDQTTFEDAGRVLDNYALWEKIPAPISAHIRQGIAGKIPDTPKPGDPIFERCHSVLVGTNRLSLEACTQAARAGGWNTLLLSSLIEGETRDVARMHAAMALEIRRTGAPLRPPTCLVSGGETTVTLRGSGLGGRNQEFALAAAMDIQGEEAMAVFSAGTDGTDGPTDAAGAIAFGDTLRRAEKAGFDASESLRNNDSYRFFDTIGDLIKTGPTNTNVMDVHLVLVR